MIDLIKGKYQVVREIARSNDIVYEARDVVLGRRIALKELNFPPNLIGQARRERIERFNREARAAGRLSHPNIVAVYDFGEENGRHFIAMEYLEGQTLRDMLQARGALSLKEAVDIACQILDALAYAHTNRVIHRDIKPDNIFLLPGGQVKLTDFGIARLTEEPSLTSDGQIFGTPSYMSPEQIEGRAIDYRSDLFSLGILLYEMLAGRKPFIGDSVVSITYAVMHADPPPLVGVPMGIEQVVRRALAKNPAQRQVSAEQMRQDLRNAEQTPALFFPPASGMTNMGQTGMGSYPGYGSGSASMMGGYSGSVPNYNAPLPSVYPGSYNPPPMAASTGMSAPQPGGQPWAWNTPGGNVLPSAGNTGQPMPSGYGGPLTGTGGIYPSSAPPFPARPSEPLFVLSPGMRTMLLAILAAILIGGAAGFGVIAFLHRYDEFQASVHIQQVAELIGKAENAYKSSDYTTAARLFQQALTAQPTPEQKAKILTELSYSYVYLARIARQNGNIAEAKNDYQQAIEYAPSYGTAHQEMSALLDSQGEHEDAQTERQAALSQGNLQEPPKSLDSSTPPLNGTLSPGDSNADGSSSGQDPNQFLAQTRAEASRLIQEGDALEAQGDHAEAESKWEQAVEKGAGFPEADAARSRLNGDNSG